MNAGATKTTRSAKAMTESFTLSDLEEAQRFLSKWPSQFTIDEVEDPEERDALLDQYLDARNIVEFARKNNVTK